MVFAGVHSLLCTNRAKLAVRRLCGKYTSLYRLVYNLVSLVMVMWVMAAYNHSPVIYFFPGIWSLVLYLVQFAIAVILIGCLKQTGVADFLGVSQLRSAIPSRNCLNVHGCYAIVRHPLYLLSSLFLILNPVMTGQWLLLSVLTVCYFLVGGCIEERRLVEEFGEEYLRYQREVPFIIPSMKKSRKPPEEDVDAC